MKGIQIPLLSLALVAAPLAAAAAQGSKVTIKEEKAGLLAKATVSADSAIATAQRRVPKGKLDSGEIEEEDGALIYSLIFKTAGKSGVDEVNVNALTGKVVGVEHESPATEAKEKAGEAGKKPAAVKPKPAPKKPPR